MKSREAMMTAAAFGGWIAASFLLVGFAAAATVNQAEIRVEPQMQVQQGRLNGCGLRFLSLPVDSAERRTLEMLDVSFNLYSSGMALVKGGALRATLLPNGQLSKAEVVPILSFWLKAPNSQPTNPVGGKVLPSDSPAGYLLYGIDLPALASLLGAITDKAPLTYGMRLKGHDVDLIHTGIAEMQPADFTSHTQCMQELLQSIGSKLQPNGK